MRIVNRLAGLDEMLLTKKNCKPLFSIGMFAIYLKAWFLNSKKTGLTGSAVIAFDPFLKHPAGKQEQNNSNRECRQYSGNTGLTT